ncbi:cation diffusion facilitator CzcD-associated flavoprotein CzcO [Panacagrimonas perspica]|uniref:Cation diffusion facilitator CzcD-associated flavoprotein CzcO n=1 Tax=Panacagrimonas perspica TaxID=381431 RepID=A0A4R7PEQ8_9GAMM|nr:alpha/beta hydrolase fold domain-containing protein [Panacagrimonas perspica]TDU32703.1 cation diffusion facilitator CzcD-associated flavoprotein CzcO [Panacagrimonas perspica]THD05586.1 esterase [Panacagrimonas perspica]
MKQHSDVIVIGAGFSGLYAVHKVRDELGLSVQGIDAAGGPGGTWWWNRYPGARCDIESIHYSYSFSDEIQREWRWSERYAAQPEILRYLEFVADKLKVREAFRYNARVTAMVWDESAKRWNVTTDDGGSYSARFIIAGGGNVGVPKSRAEFPGIDSFGGQVLTTSRWPKEGVDLSGKRVGVIGTGSTSVQMVPNLARQAAHITLFQRTPNYAVPLGNAPLDEDKQRWNAENWKQLRAKTRDRFMGVPLESPEPSALAASPEKRRERFDRLWKVGGFGVLASSYADVLTDEKANETLAEYVREKIRARVKDPKVAESLCPTDHPYGTKRPVLEADYYDMFNRDNVSLVDLRASPLEKVTATGIRAGGKDHELDVIVLATGFDAITGALMQMGIVGREGVKLTDRWASGPQTYLGICSAKFPNLFYITGPTSAVVLYNNPMAIEDHVEFATAAIKYTLDKGAETIEADEAAERAWHKQVEGILHTTLMPRANSWYMGANVPGKPRAVFIFAGGAPLYRAMCADVVDHGYAGFSVGEAPAGRVPPMIQIDAAVAQVVGAMAMQDMKPLEQCTLEETRAAVESFALMQKPAPGSVRRIESTYPGPAGPRRMYIHRPEDVEGPLPVVMFIHGGGWVAGSIDMCSAACASLAHELKAMVVAPSYRLAPEAPFPAATDDTYAALRWIAEVIGEYGGDPDQLVVMGDSAGGQLAAVAAQRARDEGGPQLMAQVLLYPGIDAEARTASQVTYANGPILSMAAARGMWSTYLGDLSKAVSPLASPNRAKSLAGLAPALVITAECDPFRDEGEDYARALQAAGVPTRLHRIEGLVHAAFYMSAFVPRTAEINQAVARFLEARRVPVKDVA